MKAFLIPLALLVASVSATSAPEEFPEPAIEAGVEERGVELRDASGFHKRGVNHKRNGWLYCGMMASKFLDEYFLMDFPLYAIIQSNCANKSTQDGDQNNLRALYDDFGSETYTAPAHGCIRAKCWNTSGVYVCNVSSHS